MGVWCCSIIVASYYANRGGNSYYGFSCGALFVDLSAIGITYWAIGAVLLWLASYYTRRGGTSGDSVFLWNILY